MLITEEALTVNGMLLLVINSLLSLPIHLSPFQGPPGPPGLPGPAGKRGSRVSHLCRSDGTHGIMLLALKCSRNHIGCYIIFIGTVIINHIFHSLERSLCTGSSRQLKDACSA